MDREPVASSNIASIGYNADEKVLEVEFLDGSIYHYFDISLEVHRAFMEASSKGRFLHMNIKGIYEFAKVE